ncbi:MAG: DNA topoisomerase 4 subunit A [Clostridia bacterium]|nr:DNA topoisomerase 4 subunit A [Clostridia bacterium]
MAKKRDDLPPVLLTETIIPRSMDDIMHSSMIPYAEHVILERALPRVEDGLKPVQRRILYTMSELSLTPDKPHRKSARIVGDCLGKYHPHGDSSVYDAMVRMAQDFNMRAPLVNGHGNFGSVDGDSAAAMRYTEARMTPLALELLRELDKDTVKFTLNFDDTLKEPDLLPGRFPNLLVNGASGIAVGLATNIPPHNLGEAIDAVIMQIDDPEVSLDELMRVMPCPDFPTGGYIIDSPEIREAYETGRAKLTMRAKTEIEKTKNGKSLIVITEIPYQVNKAKLLEDILKVSQEKKAMFVGISDIRDESDRMGTRAVVEIKKDHDAEKILQYLFKYTDLQSTFGVNMVAIADGKPQQLGLKQLLAHYIRHQENVVTKRTQFDLEAAKKREHILEGLMVAMLNLDEVIALIRASKTPKIAREGLMERFSLTQIQAQAILDLRLQRLTNLELEAIQKEYKEVKKLIKELQSILNSKDKLFAVIKKELTEIKEKYSDERKTTLLADNAEIVVDTNEFKVVDDIVVTLITGNRIRKQLKKSYNSELLEGETALNILQTTSDKRLCFFTSKGNCFTLTGEELAETKSTSKALNLNTVTTIENDETVIACVEEEKISCEEVLFFTKKGNIKRTDGKEYVLRTKRFAAITLKDKDELIGLQFIQKENPTVLMISRNGMSIRFETETIPKMGRVSSGVKCMKLDAGDAIVFFDQTDDEGEVLTITDRGYAKRSFVFEYEVQGRNGKGLKTFDFKRNGSNGMTIAAAFCVKEPFDFVIEQFHGEKTTVNTEQVLIDMRAGKGMLLVMAMLDDIVIRAYKA